MKKLIIFDLDGTLLDTLEDLQNAVNFALKPYYFPIQTKEDIRKHIGNGVEKLVSRSIPENENNFYYKNILKSFKDYYINHSYDKTVLYPNIKEIIFNLKSNGYLLAVCTNKMTKIARQLVSRLIGNYFDFIQGDDDTVEKKPSPRMIEKILKELNVDSQNVLYIGDTEVDEMTAKKASVKYLLIDYGYRTNKELLALCPNAKISSIDSLLSDINEAFN